MKSGEKAKESVNEAGKTLRAESYQKESTPSVEISEGWERLSIPKKVIREIIKEAKEELKEELEEEIIKELKEGKDRKEKFENIPTANSLKKVWDNKKDDEVWSQY